jgi:hypothetical protein
VLAGRLQVVNPLIVGHRLDLGWSRPAARLPAGAR